MSEKYIATIFFWTWRNQWCHFFSLLMEISGKILLLHVWLLCDYWSASHNLPHYIQMTKLSQILIFIPLWEPVPERGTHRDATEHFDLPPGKKQLLTASRTDWESFILVSPNAGKQWFSFIWSSTILTSSLIKW